MSDVTVAQFADVLKVPVDKLLKQLDEAGIRVAGAEARISDEAKSELLTHLRRAHGQSEEQAAAGPRKITLTRKTQTEVKVSVDRGRARTVNVEVRGKKTYINRGVLEEQARVAQEEVDRQREVEEAARRAAEADEEARRRSEEENRRRAEDEARRLADEAAKREAETRQREEAERARKATERPAAKTDAEEKPARYRPELHVTTDVSARYKKKKPMRSRRGVAPTPDGRHGFEMPTAPVKREV